MNDTSPLMTAAECAREIGITVRALRVYEDHGLLSPQRSAKNWRLYGAREISRLNEILTFKAMGFNLARITELLSGHENTMDAMLALQQTRLTDHRKRLDSSLSLVMALREKTARGEILTAADLVTLAKEMQMTDTPTNDVAWKRYEQMRPRVEIESDPEQLAEYVGYYRLADDAVAEITVTDAKIYLRMSGQMRVQMFAEAPDKFFLKALAAQVVFDRDQDTAIAGLTIHQDGLELPAPRTDKISFADAEASLRARAARTTPAPDSHNKLLDIIADHRAGTPDYASMTPTLAQVVRDQCSLLVDELERLGAVEEVAFRHVDDHGFDVFDIQFQNGLIEYGLSTASDGLLDGLYMRPATRDAAPQREEA